jgi:hypothetical protein
MHALELRDGISVSTSVINGTRRHLLLGDDAVGDSDSVIVFSESGRLVDETGTGVGSDVGVADDSEGSVLVLEEGKKGPSTASSTRLRTIQALLLTTPSSPFDTLPRSLPSIDLSPCFGLPPPDSSELSRQIARQLTCSTK